MTERLHFHFSLSCIGEGNGNPLQRSCLENPRDGGAWWAAVCEVAQSWTRLKRLSSSSSSSNSCSSCCCLHASSRPSPWLASWAASGASSCHLCTQHGTCPKNPLGYVKIERYFQYFWYGRDHYLEWLHHAFWEEEANHLSKAELDA